MAHLTQLVLVWIAVIAMTSLIFRFGWDRWHAIARGALLLVAIPPFLPMASTAMPDILATAVALVAMERLAAWKAEQKWSQGVAAAIALGLAGFPGAHLALLLPLAALFLLESSDQASRDRGADPPDSWLWTPVFAGFGLLTAIILTVREHDLGISLARCLRWRAAHIAKFVCISLLFCNSAPIGYLLVSQPAQSRTRFSPFVAYLPWLSPCLLLKSHSLVPCFVDHRRRSLLLSHL